LFAGSGIRPGTMERRVEGHDGPRHRVQRNHSMDGNPSDTSAGDDRRYRHAGRGSHPAWQRGMVQGRIIRGRTGYFRCSLVSTEPGCHWKQCRFSAQFRLPSEKMTALPKFFLAWARDPLDSRPRKDGSCQMLSRQSTAKACLRPVVRVSGVVIPARLLPAAHHFRFRLFPLAPHSSPGGAAPDTLATLPRHLHSRT
jgi:hypothetical protein